MKKFSYLFVSIFALTLLFSCQNEMTDDGDLLLKGKKTMVEVKTISFPTSGSGINPYIIPGKNPGGNRTCAEVAKAWGLETNPFLCGDKIDYNGGFAGHFPDGLIVTVSDGKFVSFEAADCIQIGEGYYKVGAVIVKGSDQANVYYYLNGEGEGGTLGDIGLAAPFNSSGTPAGLSNLTFCFVPCDGGEEPEPVYIAVKARYITGPNNSYLSPGIASAAASMGTTVFYGGGCEPIGYNKYPTITSFNMADFWYGNLVGYVDIVEPTEGSLDITVSLDEGGEFYLTWLFVGSLEELIATDTDSDGCPNYESEWIENDTEAGTVTFHVVL
jgi:hypothetical protein